MESFDVVIVGAGPAGLNCAKNLVGKRVLILEQNPVVGPKVCAGGITGEDIDYLRIPERLIDRRFSKIVIHTSKGRTELKLDNTFAPFTVDRKNLGQWQAGNLGKNVTVRTGSKVSKIGKDYVIVNGSKIRFTYLVGADGSSSIVRRHLGLESRDVGITMQYIIPEERKDMEVFLDPELFGVWYAWIFPHRGYVSVGCGCDPKIIPPRQLRENFHKWLRMQGIDTSKGRYESCPINVDFRGYRFGNVFLAGDAAGLASCLTGEGIYQALISGGEIAKIILNPKYRPERLERITQAKREEYALMNELNAILKSRGPIPEIEQRLIAFFQEP